MLCYGGFDIPNLYIEQLLSKLMMLIQHGRIANNTTIVLVWALVEAIKLEAGVCGDLLKIPLVY